jgi:hypothetical protein
MISTLIRRTLVDDQAYAALDLDNPGTPALAVAWKAGDGWRVGVDGGRTVAAQLSKCRALNLMHKTASRQLDRAATRRLLAERLPQLEATP